MPASLSLAVVLLATMPLLEISTSMPYLRFELAVFPTTVTS